MKTYAFFVLNLCLYIIDCVGSFNVKRDSLPCERLDEDLHATAQAENQMQRGFLLNIIIRKRAPVFQLLAREDESLLVWRNASQRFFCCVPIGGFGRWEGACLSHNWWRENGPGAAWIWLWTSWKNNWKRSKISSSGQNRFIISCLERLEIPPTVVRSSSKIGVRAWCLRPQTLRKQYALEGLFQSELRNVSWRWATAFQYVDVGHPDQIQTTPPHPSRERIRKIKS